MKKLSFKTAGRTGKIYFTSDLHIAHGKPFILEPRRYATVDEAIRHTFQELQTLTADDVLFNLGDVVIGAGERSEEYARRIVNLPCQQYYIHGNHNAGISNIINAERAALGLLADDVELYPLTLSNSRFTVSLILMSVRISIGIICLPIILMPRVRKRSVMPWPI
jgi:predicted phosphohydrolase